MYCTENCFDFSRNGDRKVQPADVILYEGILVFYFKPLLDLFNVKLFVDTDADTRLARRGMTSFIYSGLPFRDR